MDRLQDTKMVKRNLSNKFGFDIKFLDEKLSNSDAESAVYYFPGSGGITADDALGGCDIIESGLLLSFENKQQLNKKVSVYALYYGKDDQYQVTGSMSDEERELFIVNHLFERCLDKYKKLLNIDEICKKMARVTLVGYCRGAVEINNILVGFSRHLGEYFEIDEVKKIMSNLFCLRYASPNCGRMCPTVSVYSLSDNVIRGNSIGENFKNYERILREKIDGILVDYEKPGELMGKQYQALFMPTLIHEGIEIFSTKMVNKTISRNEHSLSLLSRNDKWEIVRFPDKNLDCVSQMFFFALAEGVERSVKTAETNELHTTNMKQLYKDLMSVELEGFKQEDLKDHTKGDGEGK